LILDAGLVGLAGLMPFYIILLRQAYQSLKFINEYELREYQYAVIVSLSGFFISGLTDRSLFPNDENCYLWAVMGFAISTIRWSGGPRRYIRSWGDNNSGAVDQSCVVGVRGVQCPHTEPA